ncbi:hypothetical protein [Nonomuraea guangzhouensis]|uniref:Uncharacterized protein n=1 Tax=Nonomuraea guangzhouensis TaxID=1291555 RepID=A0ABW4G0F3_9ACTN|nr:hypothetical protein [Nonomuraea guangzhouensis]
MIPRFAAAAWGLIVSAALVAAPLALRDRLPEPLATPTSARPRTRSRLGCGCGRGNARCGSAASPIPG